MKSEHRHELAENDLSKLLGKWGADFDKHANKILCALIVVALIAAGIIFWTRRSAATSAMGWTDLANAGSAEDFQNVAEMYVGTPVAEWATLRAADNMLRDGIRLSLTDRPASNERLAQAKSSYQALLNNTGVPKEIREQALIGIALTLESSSDGDTNAAIAAYEQLISEFPRTRFTRFAEDRIAELKTGGAQDFYAWFHRLNPQPADLPGPQDGPQAPDATDLSNLLPELGGGGIPESAPFEIPESGDAGDANPFADEEMKDKEATDEADGDAPQESPEESDAPAEKEDAKPAESPAPQTETPAQAPEESPKEPAEASEAPAGSAESTSEPAESTPSEPPAEEKPAEEAAAE